MLENTLETPAVGGSPLALTLSVAFALGIGCTEPSEDEHACGLSGDTVRACQGSTNLSANAKLGTITGASGSYAFELHADADTGDWLGDPRYGVVYVANESDVSMRVRLTRLTGDASSGWVKGEYHVNRDTEVCDAGETYCDLRWLDLADDTTGVQVEFRPSADASLCGGQPDGSLNCPCDANDACDAGLQCYPNQMNGICAEPFSTPESHALFFDSGAREDVAANVVELNCSGVRDFWGNDEPDPEYEGNPRHFVSVLASADGTRVIEVRNVSAPSTGVGPTWCVFTGEPDGWEPSLGCAEGDWSWTDTGLVLAPEDEGTVDVGTSDAALAFTVYSSRTGCPSPSDASVEDRNLVRIVDTTASVAHFYEMSDCAGEHVPVAAPFVVTPDSNDEITIWNCTDDVIELCNSSLGACDPSTNPAYSIPVNGAQQIAAGDTCNQHDFTWDENGDPTLIVRKKIDDCMDGN